MFFYLQINVFNIYGQNRRIENLPLAIARLWFKMSSENLAVRQK